MSSSHETFVQETNKIAGFGGGAIVESVLGDEDPHSYTMRAEVGEATPCRSMLNRCNTRRCLGDGRREGAAAIV